MNKPLLLFAAFALGAASLSADNHTFKFDGEGDVFGLARQTSTVVDEIDFQSEISFSEAGINFKLSNTADSGLGFALVNQGGNNSGLYVYSGMGSATYISPQIELTVPGGKISGVKLFLSGSMNNGALSSLAINFNDNPLNGEKVETLYEWTWSSEEGVETLKMGWENKFYARYIHSLEVTYTEDLGDKQPSGLAFSAAAAEGVIGEAFEAPVLENPHNLPLSWSSSDEAVATVSSEGIVTLLAAGKTVIRVETEGNDEYARGNAIYDLSVIPSASNLIQMKEVAPALYDRVKVNFPATVAFANGSYAFVIDESGNAGCFENIKNQGSTSTIVQTIYKVGDVIPSGWVATNAMMYENMIWQGLPGEVTQTAEVTYPVVESVSPADVDRVVILNDVTFSTPTASDNTKAYGTLPSGKVYEFQNTYNVKEYPAGVYNVTSLVKYSKRGTTEYFYLAPIAYEDMTGVETIESDTEARYFNIHGNEVVNPGPGVYVKVADSKVMKVVVR